MDQALVSLIGDLVKTGVLGTMLAVFIVMYVRKDKALQDVTDKYTDRLISLSRETVVAVAKTGDIASQLAKQQETIDRQRSEVELAREHASVQRDTPQAFRPPMRSRP